MTSKVLNRLSSKQKTQNIEKKAFLKEQVENARNTIL